MIKNLCDLEKAVYGTYDVYAKPAGNKLYFDGNVLKKTKEKEISIIDRLISDQYTTPESKFNSDVPVGWFTYNSEFDVIIAEGKTDKPGFLGIEPSFGVLLDMATVKLARMNHTNKILKHVGQDEQIKKYLHSLIFKQEGKPIFKIQIKEIKPAVVDTGFIKMTAYLFFSGTMPELLNIYTERCDTIVSLTNQLFTAKYDSSIDIDRKTSPYSYITIKDTLSKLKFISNEQVIRKVTTNPMSYYFYITVMILLMDKSFDQHIRNNNILGNLSMARNAIDADQTVLPSYNSYQLCKI